MVDVTIRRVATTMDSIIDIFLFAEISIGLTQRIYPLMELSTYKN
jgi:hypothetical protein